MDKLKKQTKRVILFGIDGAGTFFEQAETPNIDRIFKEGAVSNRTLTELPSISAECWGSMLHGVDCTMHGLTNSIAAISSLPFGFAVSVGIPGNQRGDARCEAGFFLRLEIGE